MPQVALIVEAGCPNVAEARKRLREAFAALGAPARWQEFDARTDGCPSNLRRHGSPSVLVDGKDVGASDGADASSCRVYVAADGTLAGVPPVEAIVRELQRAGIGRRGNPKRSVGFFAALPTIGAALLPKLTCPLCWPAYTALLGALGVGFVDYTPYLPALTALLLTISIGSLAYLSRRRRTALPLLCGLAGGVLLWLGRFALESDPVTYGAVALLALAPWIPALLPKSAACADCVPDTQSMEAMK